MDDILIIDDTPENLTVLRQILITSGFRVRPAISGEIALKAIQEQIPDLILLDIMMPGLDGFEVCARLKSDSRTQHIPIIFISALGDTENKIKGFQAGGVDYIAKPFSVDEVLARVETHLTIRNLHVQLLGEIEERKSAQEALQRAKDELEQRVADRTAELYQKNERLREMNIALKVLLEKREEDKKELERKIVSNIERLISPYLEKLKTMSRDEYHNSLLKIIQSNISEVTSTFAHTKKNYLVSLTPTQIQIADLVKQGLTTKEIASLLNLSPSTISSHRREIRKRLSLEDKKINLQTALTTDLNN